MSETEVSALKKMMATICHHCPMCSYGRNHPDSLIGKVLHHKYHADNCPFWKAEKAVYQEKTDAASEGQVS